MWVLLRSGDTALVPEPSYPIHQFSCIFAGAEVTSVPLTHDTADFFADLTAGLRAHLAAAAGHPRQLPAQPDRPLRRPRLLRAPRALRAGQRRRHHPRLRLRRDRVRRLPAAEHLRGAGGQGRGRRVRLAEQEPQHVRLARGLLRRQRGGWWPASSGSRATSTTASSSPSRSPPSSRSTTATRCRRRWPRCTSGAATCSATVWRASAGRCTSRAARCSCGRRSRSPTATWARSSSASCCSPRRRWR